MHELQIRARFFDDKRDKTVILADSEYDVEHKYLKPKESNENLVIISNLIIPPRAEVIISFGVLKSLMQFEQYPNDPARGENVAQMPILYKF